VARSDINSVRNLYHIAWAVRPYIAFAVRQIYRVAKQHIDKTRFIELFQFLQRTETRSPFGGAVSEAD